MTKTLEKKIWVSFATDCWGYSEEDALEMYKDNGGKFSEFLSDDEQERMFEWGGYPTPARNN